MYYFWCGVSNGEALKKSNGIHLHWDKNEAHHHSQAETGDGHHMEVPLQIRSALKARGLPSCTHSELLLFSHAVHVGRVGGLYLAKSRIRGFVAMGA
jgi:hypothetical protein